MRRAYELLLQLYPRDFRSSFTPEMLTAFENSATEHRAQGRAIHIRFALRELIGVLMGVPAEWIAKLTTDSSLRGRSLPDQLMMRPPGVPWEAYYGGALMPAPDSTLPYEVMEAQRRTEFLVKRIVHAIAHHDFEGARNYSYQERQARENLRLLQEKYKCSSDTWRSA
jgi:hypothetical protein